MKLLYAPWRGKYFKKKEKKVGINNTCPFCNQPKELNDNKNFILKRYEYCFIMLNLHPYNAGHLLVVPYKHKPKLYNFNKEERLEFIEAINEGTNILKKVLKFDGVNIGINIGKASGGSISAHLHAHIIPRWYGDTNFLVASANTKQIPFDLNEIYEKLYKFFNKN